MHFFTNNFTPLQHAAFAALRLMLQMVQLGEMQHLCSIRGSLLKEGPHLLQMLHRADAVLRCAVCCGALTSPGSCSCCMMRRAAWCSAPLAVASC
jgi:hypothetical protein